MIQSTYSIILAICLSVLSIGVHGQADYHEYHNEVIKCEKLIAERKFSQAISSFDSLIQNYHFVFLRDCKLATQLSAYTQDSESGFPFLRLGIANGWTLKDIEKNDFLNIFKVDPQWETLQLAYDSLRSQYLARLNNPLRQQVHKMYKRDQRKALGALFRIGNKAQERYNNRKFAPHSEKQLAQLDEILTQSGYPGEQLIGNKWWASVILSHHNSISEAYNSKDTLYSHLRPKLMNALKKGEVSPYVLATIEDWRTAALNGHKLTSYGFLGRIPDDSVLETVNENRARIGLRSIELRNSLIDIEKETGLNLYLPKGWQKGKITVASKS